MIKAILFDCFGVLTTDTWRVFLESLPADSDVASARQAHRDYNSGIMTKQDCNERIREATGGHSFTELDDATAGAFTKNTNLIGYIRELHDRGFKISILSNVGSNWIREQLLSADEQKYIDDYVFSYEVGMVKPDSRMYKLACERLNVQPREALFVDDKEPYCAAARKVGMQAICYENFPQAKSVIENLLAAQA